MPYTPYQPTWQNPYLPVTNQGQPVLPTVQPYQQPVNGVVKVNGRDSEERLRDCREPSQVQVG